MTMNLQEKGFGIRYLHEVIVNSECTKYTQSEIMDFSFLTIFSPSDVSE